MWKDINGKTGYKGLQGNNYYYSNLRLMSKKELETARVDGIIPIIPKPTQTPPEPSKTELLQKAKIDRGNDIRSTFTLLENAPVTDVNGVTWQGGFLSAMKLDAALRLSENMGLTAVTFYDIDNDPHNFIKDDAVLVINTVAAKYSSGFALKQKTMNKIKNVKSLTALGKIKNPWIS